MTTPTLQKLKVKLFTDGADKAQIVEMAKQPWIAGFTTNPSLLKKAGVSDYAAYGRDLVAAVPDRHISFEVFSDDIPEMVAQARVITTWGKNVYVKLPVTNTRGEPLVRRGAHALARRRQDQHDRDLHRRAGRARHRGAGRRRAGLRLRLCRPACRLRHRLSADRAGRDCARARRPAMSRSSGPRRARSSTSSRPTRWAATSSRRPPTCSRSFRRSAPRPAAELSLGAVKAFREDAVAAGLRLAVPALAGRRMSLRFRVAAGVKTYPLL